jgi:hypothetical protein
MGLKPILNNHNKHLEEFFNCIVRVPYILSLKRGRIWGEYYMLWLSIACVDNVLILLASRNTFFSTTFRISM